MPLDPEAPALLSKFMREAKRAAKGEEVSEVSSTGGSLYAFTTELGMYRIWDKYTNLGKSQGRMRRGYSPTYNSHYVALDMG